MGLVAILAYRYKIPVYFANPLEIIKTVRPYQINEHFRKYPDYFNSLSETQKRQATLWARQQLEKRINGDVGINMRYQIESAFTEKRIERQTSQSDKIKILITPHCFYDNPHGYGGMPFPDFYEWLCFLGEISKITDYEWYLKPHPVSLPGTFETLTSITGMYPKFQLINPKTTFHQLKEEGVSIALTCYGSIGHELPLLGYKVINAAYNPHIAYKFNWHPETLEEYRNILLNLQNLGEIQGMEKVYEFFYIHKAFIQPDDFLFESYERYLEEAGGDPMSVSAYNAFLSQKDVFERKVDEKMDRFIISGKTYSYQTGIGSGAAQILECSQNMGA